ncbi:MAG: hypothetical protein R3B84_20070 [Zavarzinella sp.]
MTLRRLGWCSVLLLGTVSAVTAQQPLAKPNTNKDEPNWLQRNLLGQASAPEPKAEVPTPTVVQPPSKETIRRSFEMEKTTYLRRLASISKIKQLADMEGRSDLVLKAEALEREATTIYEQRLAQLPGLEEVSRIRPNMGIDATRLEPIAPLGTSSANNEPRIGNGGQR